MITPTRQLPARDLIARGIGAPYWHPSDRDHEPVNYHLTVALLPMATIDKLVIAARKYSAMIRPSKHDCRESLDYVPTDKERCNFVRHVLINLTENAIKNLTVGTLNGRHGGYDNLLSRIARGTPDPVTAARRQYLFKQQVLVLIASWYPSLVDECHRQLFNLNLNERNAP